jgi:stalled ribosome rescue protein Dom34
MANLTTIARDNVAGCLISTTHWEGTFETMVFGWHARPLLDAETGEVLEANRKEWDEFECVRVRDVAAAKRVHALMVALYAQGAEVAVVRRAAPEWRACRATAVGAL